MSREKNFPNDKRVIVLRKDLTKYKTWESQNLIKVHNWTPSEVRVHQLSYLSF
ncbi:MAG: hypothetical protein P8P29_08500 [Flavobacteriaceae bacterium]|nr:hypothetical protein [Flavobacteriaceae bacterium]